MANTLVQYKYLGAAAEIRAGIAKTIVTESPWLRELPFVEINNNVSRYKMESGAARADTYEVGDTWIEGTPTWGYRDAPLAILGGDADDDNFGKLAAGGENTLAAMVELKSKAVGQWFEALAIYGRTTSATAYSAAKNFKGLLRLIAEAESDSTVDLDGALYSSYGSGGNNPQVVQAASGASATLTLDMIDVLLDVVRPKATHIICSRQMRNKIGSLARAAGSNLEHDHNELGFLVTRYGEQTILIDDSIKNNMDDPTGVVTEPASYDITQSITDGADTSPIFAVRFGEDGLCGINGEGMIQTEFFDKLETKDAQRVRIKFYAGMRLTNKLAAGALLSATDS
jgi:hypothetical protein